MPDKEENSFRRQSVVPASGMIPTGRARSETSNVSDRVSRRDSDGLNQRDVMEVDRAPENEQIPNGPNEKDGIASIEPSGDNLKTDPFPNELAPLKLARTVESKNLEMLEAMGGVQGILQGLGTDAKKGLSSSSAIQEERQRVFGRNSIPSRKSKSLLWLMWSVLRQKVLALLSVAAIVALALGLFQDFGAPRETYTCGDGQTCTEPPLDWVKGVAIMIAVAIVVIFSSLNDWQKERQFRELNEKKDDRTVKVMRDGSETIINVKDLVVGDVAILDPGEVVPSDGIFLYGYNVRCDESSVTGESDVIKKVPYEECCEAKATGQLPAHSDCFVISGSKVIEGVGSYLIIAVGELSCNGRIMMAVRSDTENTPLQNKLKKLADLIGRIAITVALLLFSVLMIRFFVQLGRGRPARSASEKGHTFVDILVISVSLFVVAIPEGLPLAVTLALGLATKRMTAEKLLVRVLAGCETMANASVICTDKTGTLTRNFMTVVAGAIGIQAEFARDLKENRARVKKFRRESSSSSTEGRDERNHHWDQLDDFVLDMAELGTILSSALEHCINEAICVNSTAFEDVDPETGKRVFVGNKTETALLTFAKDLGWQDYRVTRERTKIVQMIPFSSERKAMGVVVEVGPGVWRLYLKGASEELTKKCTQHVVVRRPGENISGDQSDDHVETKEIGEAQNDNISRTISFYANQALRTIALCYRDLHSWPPKDSRVGNEEVPVAYEDLAVDLTLIGIVGIEDPLRDGVREAVSLCRKAGVAVKMCTGDNVLTARSIAQQCGMSTPAGVILEGPAFRKLDDRQMLEIVPKLQVLARSSPEDKKILVEKLRELGEIVGVTGDGTNDGPALKTAHVGFSMGLTGTEVAKEASDIILMDDNFASIIKAIMWGRCINDAIRKFLQFQITANITAVFTTFVSAVVNTQDDSALSAVQLLWVNIIVNTFAALALATDPASPVLLDRKPDKITAPLFNVDMYKQMLGQSLYQTTIILVFHFAGNSIFGFSSDANNEAVQIRNEAELDTLVFNAFVFAQIFNSINCRVMGNRKNVFDGLHRNPFFISVILLEIGIQIVIVFMGGQAFSVTAIDGMFWGISLALGFMSIPIGFLLRCIPNPPLEHFLCKLGLLRDTPILPAERPNTDTDKQCSVSGRRAKLVNKIRKGIGIARNSLSFSRSSTLVSTGVDGSSPIVAAKSVSLELQETSGPRDGSLQEDNATPSRARADVNTPVRGEFTPG